MCTLTLIPTGKSTLRMAVNRDESRQRAVALPPVVRAFGRRQAILPIDPVGGGTWVAVSDAGLAFVLLNRRTPTDVGLADGARTRADLRSRGLVIPAVLAADDLVSAREHALALDARLFNPFRLLMTDGHRAIELGSNGERFDRQQLYEIAGPLMFTSSGLGDQVVEGPRRELFNTMFHDAPTVEWPGLQTQFQRHSWPDRREVSVCMSRPEARTVSLTVIDLDLQQVTLRYHGEAPDRAADEVTLVLPRSAKMPAGVQ